MKEFHDSPVVRTQCFYCCGPSSIPGQGTKILRATLCAKKKKKGKKKRESFKGSGVYNKKLYISVTLGNTFM